MLPLKARIGTFSFTKCFFAEKLVIYKKYSAGQRAGEAFYSVTCRFDSFRYIFWECHLGQFTT
jgi:hypothetical protein